MVSKWNLVPDLGKEEAHVKPFLGLLALGSELLRLRALQLAALVLAGGFLWPSAATSLMLVSAGLLLTALQAAARRACSERIPKLTSDQLTLVVVNGVWMAAVVYLWLMGLQHACVLRAGLLAFADHFLLLTWDTLCGNKTGRPFGSSRSSLRRRQALVLGLIGMGLLAFAVQGYGPAAQAGLSIPAVTQAGGGAPQAQAQVQAQAQQPAPQATQQPFQQQFKQQFLQQFQGPDDPKDPAQLAKAPGVLQRAADSPLVREFLERERARQAARQLHSIPSAVPDDTPEAAGATKTQVLSPEASTDPSYGGLFLLAAVATNLGRELWVRRRALRAFSQSHRGRYGLSSSRKRLQGLSCMLAGAATFPLFLANVWLGSPPALEGQAGAPPVAAAAAAASPDWSAAVLAVLGIAVFQFVVPAYLGPRLSEFLNEGFHSKHGGAGRDLGLPAGVSSLQPPSLLHSFAGSGAKWYVLWLFAAQLWLSGLLGQVLSGGGDASAGSAATGAWYHDYGLLGGAVCLLVGLVRLFPGGAAGEAGNGSLPGYTDEKGLVYGRPGDSSSSSLLLSSSAKYLQTTLESGAGWSTELRLIWRHISASKETFRIFLFFTINFIFMFVEFLYGFWTNSLGLISDAGHMMFDCAALAIGLYASYITRKKVNAVYTYGYGRYEVLSGFANGVFLLFIGFFVLVEGIERIFEPPEIHSENLVLVSVLGLLVNMVGLVFFHDHGGGHGHSHGGDGGGHGHSHGGSNMNVSGIFLHVLADALGSVGVITSSLLIKYFDWYLADSICSIFISVLIVASVIPLVRQSASILLQATPPGLDASIRDSLISLQNDFPGDVLDIGDSQCWAFVDGKNVLTVQLRVAPTANDQRILARCNTIFRERLHIDQLCVQIEPIRDHDHNRSTHTHGLSPEPHAGLTSPYTRPIHHSL